MAKKLPVLLALSIVSSLLLNNIMPLAAKQMIFAVALTIKSIVLFLLPLIIFGLLFKTFVKLSEHAICVIFLIFGSLCTSNFINTFLSHYVGEFIYNYDFNVGNSIANTTTLTPYFSFELPKLVKNEYALFGGIVIGIVMAIVNRPLAEKCAKALDQIIRKVFAFVSLLIPLFIIGFVFKCASEGVLMTIITSYSKILGLLTVYSTVYTLLLYLLVNGGRIRDTIQCLKNMMPALLGAMSTMSSVMTMPITIMCAEKNAKNKGLAGSIISATVNVHLLGDCLCIPVLAYALLKHYGLAAPTLEEYFIFTIFFVITKFSVAAVPAGGIIVMTPVLESYLHFTPDMSTLMIAICAMFDPIMTGFNVLGNGALAKFIDNMSAKFKIQLLPEST